MAWRTVVCSKGVPMARGAPWAYCSRSSTRLYPLFYGESFRSSAFVNNYHEAIKFYGIAYKLNANSYLVLGNLASVHEAVGNDDLAREYYLKAITLAESQLNVNPHDVEVINDLGAYYADIGENTQALKYLSRSVELDSNNVEVLYRTGAAYERMGDRESALKWMGTAIEKGYLVSDILNQPELQELVTDNRFKEMSGKAEGQSQ